MKKMEEKIKSLQYKTKANDVDEKGIVTVAVNGIGVKDSQNDISMPGSFNKTLKENIYNGGCFWQPLFIFYNTHKTLFNIFLNCPALTILSTDFSSFSYKYINFAAENVKSSL